MPLRLFPAILCICPALGAEERAADKLHVITFNVKVDMDMDDTCPPWEQRKDRSLAQLLAADADLLGLQECSPAQFAFFREGLPAYDVIGDVPFESDDPNSPFALLRAMGITAYTDVLLFYKRDLFTLVEEGRWWLSPTPEKISTGFGNLMPRVLMWAKLKHVPTGRHIAVAVTHFDNNMPAPAKMAALAHEKLKALCKGGDPVIFMGDFNTDQRRGDYPMLVSDGWQDAYRVSPLASADGRDDNVSTSSGRRRIDHVFYFGETLQPVEWQALGSLDPALAVSDHLPISVHFAWAER